MKKESEKLLQKICSLSKCDFGYILIDYRNKHDILASCGSKFKGSYFDSLNKILTNEKEPSLTEIKNSKAFLVLKEEYGFNAIYKEIILKKKKQKYLLVLLSKTKLTDAKTLKKKLLTALNQLKKEIEKENTNKSSTHKSDIDFLFNSHTPFIITASDYSVLQTNSYLANMFGVSWKEINYNFLKVVKFFDSSGKRVSFERLPFIAAALENKNITDFELKYAAADNSEKWFRINSFVVNSFHQDPVFVLSFFSDISKEAEIKQSFRETIHTINTVLYSTNAEGSEYNFISEAVRPIFGFEPAEIYQNKLRMLRSIVPDHFNLFKKFIEKLRRGEKAVVEYRMKDRFGKEHWVRHSGYPIFKNDLVVRIVGVIQDITEEKNIQLRLERSEEKFRMLIDTADDLIFTLDGFGNFNMVNKNGAGALGYAPDEMIGRHFLEFIDKDDESKIADVFNKILGSSGITVFEAQILDRFDEQVIFEIHAKPVFSEGVISGMLSIGRNITNRKLDEQKIRDLNAKLIEANRIVSIERERARHKITVLEELNKLKSEFISNVSHELRTPLASIVGFAETLYLDHDLPKDTLKEFSNIILTEGKRLGKLINDLLDFSKLEAGEEDLHKTSVNIIDLLEAALADFQGQINEKKLVLTREYIDQKLIIYVDKERMVKVFASLISNAVKFTPSGGRISVIVQDYGKEIEIDVSDTGAGIPAAELPNLFQKFNKIQRPGAQLTGAGFGLVSAKQIVDLHRGFIKIRSEEEKGTTVIIRLPK